jgi:hypothetical protein
MGCSCRTFREELWARPCISFAEPSIKRHPPTLGGNAKRVPEPPALGHPPHGKPSGGVLVLAKDKPLSGTRVTARTLGTRARNGRRESPCRYYACSEDEIILRPRFGNSVRGWSVSACMGGPAARQGGAPMSTVAAAARTADRIDHWIRQRVILYCHRSP